MITVHQHQAGTKYRIAIIIRKRSLIAASLMSLIGGLITAQNYLIALVCIMQHAQHKRSAGLSTLHG
jgi:hypothetical protein